MANVLESIRAKAKSLGRKVCLTESDDPRNLKAAEKLAKLGYVKPVHHMASTQMHCVLSHFNHVQLFATLWTVAHQAPLSMGFSRQEG